MPRQPGAKAIVVYREKILLVLRDDVPTIPFPNVWNTPGGGIEDGESPEEALARELAEEICVSPSTVIALGTTTHADGSVVHRYFVPLTDDEFRSVRLGNEGQRLDWFTYNEILALSVLTPNFFVYFTTHERDIREVLSGKRTFEPRHETI